MTSRKILIVDDMEEIHWAIKKILSPSSSSHMVIDDDFEITEEEDEDDHFNDYVFDDAYHGEKAIEFVFNSIDKGDPYHAIFMDVRMPPGEDGICIIEKITDHNRKGTYIICTAYMDYDMDELIEKFQELNLFIINKPFSKDELRRVMLQVEGIDKGLKAG